MEESTSRIGIALHLSVFLKVRAAHFSLSGILLQLLSSLTRHVVGLRGFSIWGRTEEQILHALRQAENGTRVSDICREHGISEATY